MTGPCFNHIDNMKSTTILIAICLAVHIPISYGHELPDTTSRAYTLQHELKLLTERDSAYNRAIDISVVKFPVDELIRGMAVSNNLSINLDIERGKTITCNLRKVPIKDILYFICIEKALELSVSDNIISISDFVPESMPPVIKFEYDSLHNTLSFDFTKCRIDSVSRHFNDATGKNIIFPISISDKKISGFGSSLSIDESILAIAAINNLASSKENNSTWSIYEPDKNHPSRNTSLFKDSSIQIDSAGFISAHLYDSDMSSVISEVLDKLKKNYFLTGDFNRRVNINADCLDLETFLDIVFTGTPITWKETNNVYIIGEEEYQQYLSSVKVYTMKYRTVEKIIEIIPSHLKSGMEIKTFPDLNSLVISGDIRKVEQIIDFMGTIDRSVPLIAIDVMIVDATDNSSQSLGLGLGVGSGKETTGGSVSPGIDFSLNAESIGRILGSFSGLGTINLGPVSQLFYADLQFLEEAGKITLRSTPRLSTLNGHKAVLKSGEVKYYKESQVNIIGTQNPLQSESYLWKNVEANFILDITPYMSQDSTITMTINLSQDEFTTTDEEDKYAPPGISKRSFTSIIKVKDQEMVLLGGIEKNIRNNSSRGLPYVARVPFLRSIFGKTQKQKSESKLNIFIRPTIL